MTKVNRRNAPPRGSNTRFAFFGTSHIATIVLDELERAGFVPAVVVTMPPKPKGRGMKEVPTDVDAWARARGIEVLYPDPGHTNVHDRIRASRVEVGVVVDYGKILPASLLEAAPRGFLNVHPSLLPRLRGASPIRTAILRDERDTGVTIIRMDDKMDHGPIVAQRKVALPTWPIRNAALERILLAAGGALLAQVLPEYVAGRIEPQEQNHDIATYTRKCTKEDGLLDLRADAYANLRKIYALEGWPGTYALFLRSGKQIRVGIIEAHLENGALVLDTVKPEGKKEMRYKDFERSGAEPL